MVVELKELLKKAEGSDFDRIESSKNRDSLGEKIAAFATSEGGIVLIGQGKDGAIQGVEDEQVEITRIGEVLRSCEPIPTVEGPFFGEAEGKRLCWIRVISLGRGGPCFYKGVAYKRMMDTCQKISANEIYRIWARTGRISFELRPSNAPKEAIDRETLSFYMKKAGERGKVDERNFLEARHLAEKGVLTNLGVIVLAERPSDFLPRPSVSLIRFRGTMPTERIASASLSMPIHKLIPACENFIKLNIPVKEEFEGLRRTEKPAVPIKAIREALINAIAHRDYESSQEVMIRIFDDRIEFSNPGAPDSELLKKILETGLPVHRNPQLYEFLRMEGFGEGAGQGIAIMREEMAKEGLPEPKFQTLMDLFVVALYSIREKKPRTGEFAGIMELAKKGPVTSSSVMAHLGVSRPTAIRILAEMEKAGMLVHTGRGRSSRYMERK